MSSLSTSKVGRRVVFIPPTPVHNQLPLLPPRPRAKVFRGSWQVDYGRPSDAQFVIDSWCSDEMVKAGRPAGIDSEVFKVGQRERILRLLGSCKLAVIRPTPKFYQDNPDHDTRKDLWAWCLYALDRKLLRPIVHFVYTKAEFRKLGLARSLLDAAGVRDQGCWCTHTRFHLRQAADRHGLIYNPYLLDYDPDAKPKMQDPIARQWR